MQEMTMVERVAREISKSRVGSDYYWKEYKREARAAIEAMRTPTSAMMDEGNAHDECVPYDIYESMIDAALTE